MKRSNPATISSKAMALRALLPLFLLFASGCFGYRLGTTLPPGIKTVHVPTFRNETEEPELELETTRATLQEFQRDGTLKVVDKNRADLILSVRLTHFTLEPLRYDPNRPRTTSEYRVLITAHLLVTRMPSGNKMLEKWISGETTFNPGGDVAAAKVRALPVAAEDLAHDIVESVVEYW